MGGTGIAAPIAPVLTTALRNTTTNKLEQSEGSLERKRKWGSERSADLNTMFNLFREKCPKPAAELEELSQLS